MPIVNATPITLTAVLVGGLATVVFPSRPYRRGVVSVAMRNPSGGRVTIYRGTLNSSSLVSSNPVGTDQTYSVPFILPAGQGLYVQWANAPTPTSLALAVLTWMEER